MQLGHAPAQQLVAVFCLGNDTSGFCSTDCSADAVGRRSLYFTRAIARPSCPLTPTCWRTIASNR
jgi:hypothetical protein